MDTGIIQLSFHRQHPFHPLPTFLSQKSLQLISSSVVPQFSNGAHFDLANALASDAKHLSDLFERIAPAPIQSVTESDHLSFAFWNRLENLVQGGFEKFRINRFLYIWDVFVLNEVSKSGIRSVFHRLIQRNGFL